MALAFSAWGVYGMIKEIKERDIEKSRTERARIEEKLK